MTATTFRAVDETSPPLQAATARARSEALRPILEPLAARGIGTRLIAQALAHEGVVSPSGRPLDATTIRRHLGRLGLQTAAQIAGKHGGTAHNQRIRAGLQRAQARGVPIGKSPGAIAAREARAAAATAWAEGLRERFEEMAAAGLSWREMTQALAADGVTRDGQPVGLSAVRRALQRLGIRTARSKGTSRDGTDLLCSRNAPPGGESAQLARGRLAQTGELG